MTINNLDMKKKTVRGLVMSAYRSGYNKAHSEHVKRITNIVELKLSDIDSPVFTQEHFDYIMSKIKEQFA
jgi:tryptophanase